MSIHTSLKSLESKVESVSQGGLDSVTSFETFEEPFEDDFVDAHDFHYGADGQNDAGFEFDYADVAKGWEDDWDDHDDIVDDRIR